MSTFHTSASLRNFQRLIERIDAEAMREETSFPKSLTATVPESFRFPVARFEREAWTYLRSVANFTRFFAVRPTLRNACARPPTP